MSGTSARPTAAFFCPVPFLVGADYLAHIRRRILQNPFLHPLGDAIKQAPKLWDLLVGDSRAAHVAFGDRGREFAKAFQTWMETGEPGLIASQRSTIVSFPLLIVTGIHQWCTYLEMSGLSQSEVIESLNIGGIQGYCGGILSAVTVSSAGNEEELGRRAADAFLIAFVLGVFMSEGEVGPPENEPDMVIVRLKYPGQDKELMEQFPGIYASATTNPVTICFAGRKSELVPLKQYVAANRMFSIQTYPTGTGHDPRNKKHLANMLAIMSEQGLMGFAAADALRVIVQSNNDGEQLANQTPAELGENILGNILCGRCEWYTVVEKLAERLHAHYGKSSHSILLLGGYDCVPVEPFNQSSLKVTKIDVVLTLKELMQSQAEVNSYNDDAIAVVGSACRIPGANDLDELWDMLEQGVSKCEEVRPERVPLSGSHRASLDPKFTSNRKWFGNFIDNVDQFDNDLFGLSPAEAAWMDPQQRILLELAFEALDSHGHLGHKSHRREAGQQVGCFIGGTLLEYNEHTSTHAPTAYSAIGTMQAFQCGRISHHFGWYGPSETIDTACSSSLVAISRAVSAIRAGDCHMAVAGGANILGGVNYYLDLAKARFLSPTGQCKVFDVTADGYCRADGAGIVVLKKLKDALASGDQVLAVIAGAGTNQGGLSKGITLPDGQAQRQLYQRVLKSAGLKPTDISYIECHGTGTQAGDPNEIGGLRAVFGDESRESKLHVGSIKGNVGHAEAAAGVTGLMKVLTMLRNGKIPPQASFNELNPNIGALEPFKMAIPAGSVKPWDAPENVRRALVNSYGAAGSNASLVVCQAPGKPPKSAWWLGGQKRQTTNGSQALPVLVTAASKASLQANCRALAEALRADKPAVGDFLWTLSEKRQRHKFRAAFSVDSTADPLELADTLEKTASSTSVLPQKTKPVVLVFGGQSQRTVHLDRNLYDTSPALRRHLAECDDILTSLGYPPVTADLLNHEKVDQDVLLLQTGTFAAQYSCAKTWEDAGLPIQAAVGHSFGELTALAFTGALSLHDGIRVVAQRASLMQTAWGPEKGIMLAVHGPLKTAEDLTAAVPGLEIACHNSLASHVVVGKESEIKAAEGVLEARFSDIRFQRVDVTHGFHSKFVDDILPGLKDLDASLTFTEPRIHLELCVDDQENTTTPEPGHVGRHARNPVFFTKALTRIAEKLGPAVWLEAGTDSPIIGMAKRAVPDSGNHSFQPMKFKGTRSPEKVICDVTIALWRLAIDFTYWPWIGAKDLQVASLPQYQFNRKSFWTQWVDHPTELQKRLDEAVQQQPLVSAATAVPAGKLVSPAAPNSNRYPVNINSSRFQQIVSGHAVCGQPMCPASMYMECVTQSVQIYESSARRPFGGAGVALSFKNVVFENLITLRPDQEVAVVLDLQPDDGRSWAFRFESIAAGRTTVHARGVVSQVASPDVSHLKVLLSDRTHQLKFKPDAETINSRRFYTLFGTLVDYSAVLRGVESTTIHENWAVGTVKSPKQIVATHETEDSVLAAVDAAIADNFVQVLGLAINTSDHVSPGLAYLLSHIDSFTFLPTCNLLEAAGTWTVVSHYTPDQSSKAIGGQVYVLDQRGDVVAYAMGVSFAQIRLNTLGRILSVASGGKSQASESVSLPHHVQETLPSFQIGSSSVPAVVPSIPAPPPTITAPVSAPPPAAVVSEPQAQEQASAPSANVESKVREVVARYTGAMAEEMPADSTMTELGIDSLAIVEFADEMSSLFKKEFSKDDLSDMALQALISACGSGGGSAPSAGDASSVPSRTVTPTSDDSFEVV